MKRILKVGLIGLGGRSIGLMNRMTSMSDVVVYMVCDTYEDRVERAKNHVEEKTGSRPIGTNNYHEILACPEVDCVVISTSWQTHTQIAIDAMKAGKYVGVEVGGAYDIEDCWQLVRTHEETGTHLMLLENCCYGENELAVLNMAKAGMFGKIVHCQASYEHDLRKEVAMGRELRKYRFINFLKRCGDLYPTHGLGPIAKILNINNGNRMVSLTSMSSSAEGLKTWIDVNAPADSDMRSLQFAQGDVTTTMIRCAGGETILLTHNVTLPRPYSRGNRVEGTLGIYMEDKDSVYIWDQKKDIDIEGFDDNHQWESFADYREKYAHPLWRKYKKDGVQPGHGGVDYLAMSAFFDSVRENKAPPIDVYDAVSWMVITCLSEQSVAMGSHPVAIPDFTRGRWMSKRPIERSIYALDEICWELFPDSEE